MILSENTSKRITALRYLLILLLVFDHNNFTKEFVADSTVETVFNQSVFGEWLQFFISDAMTRCIVPLFFMFSSFLLAKKADPYPVLLKKRCKSLLVPFVLWTCLYLFYYGGLKIVLSLVMPQLLNHPQNTMLGWTLADWVHQTLGYEIPAWANCNPGMAFQLWFVRDLLVLTALSPVLTFLIRKMPIMSFFLVSVALIFLPQVYFVKTNALFFYVMGLYWGMYDVPLFERADGIRWAEAVSAFVFGTVAWKLGWSGCGYFIVLFSSCLLMLKFSAVIVARDKWYSVAAYLSEFSFFLYAIHAPVLHGLIERIWLRFFPMVNGFFCLFEYFGVTILVAAIGTGLGIGLKKLCPPLFGLLNGGRQRQRS